MLHGKKRHPNQSPDYDFSTRLVSQKPITLNIVRGWWPETAEIRIYRGSTLRYAFLDKKNLRILPVELEQ